jgi:hypothetical protein
MHDVQSDSVGLLKQVMVMLLLQSAIHHRSRMRLYYWLRPRTHRAVKTAEEAGCELRPSPLVEGAVLAPGRSSKGGGALEFELPKTAETAATRPKTKTCEVEGRKIEVQLPQDRLQRLGVAEVMVGWGISKKWPF